MLKIANHPMYVYPLPKGHRFPMEKYELLPQQLLYEGTCIAENFFEPEMPLNEDILAIHTEEYFESLLNLTIDKRAARKIGFPLSKELIERELRIAQGTIEGCEYALNHGIAMNIAGGTHHAYTNHGEGFCMFNDQAIAARYLQKKKLADKILIVDLDVHQGNGTAEIFKNDPSVFTFSMHGAGNYPFKKEKSDLDIAVPDGSGDEIYLQKLKQTLPKLIDEQNPDFIFYLSGVDILETDKLGRLNCTVEGCKERDHFVLGLCKDLDIPVQVSMGGGYSPDIKIIIEAHSNTFRVAQEIYF
ncbi:histone deacetylase family protein [Aequorivita viscosa]|uniref:Acetoin utilization deacetylase AcuC n=1 Tax=Aequorivita viscosa TaxID=797419 RepID=A0A1M6P1V8_9FLAO|nr:histone deacetylase [Aequorivita viscosa]SDW25816.1 Acetoin utilization deacetylase AcuC [Aequorivita viscosa]SHK01898.1 Acetoin utilization deacetylase AcuC [Aequorivita viscosa]